MPNCPTDDQLKQLLNDVLTPDESGSDSNPTTVVAATPHFRRITQNQLDDDTIDAFVQVGTNLSMVKLCDDMAIELDKPMIPINAATYWHALRAMGITDQFGGQHWLFERH